MGGKISKSIKKVAVTCSNEKDSESEFDLDAEEAR
jgi:hypothetical protein